MKKVVMKLALRDDKEKQKAMKTISGLSGIDSIAVDMKEKKMTVVGEVDPVEIVGKLRKLWQTEIVSVGPAKEEKKAEPKKDAEKGKDPNEHIAELARAYGAYNTIHYHPLTVEENPNSSKSSYLEARNKEFRPVQRPF